MVRAVVECEALTGTSAPVMPKACIGPLDLKCLIANSLKRVFAEFAFCASSVRVVNGQSLHVRPYNDFPVDNIKDTVLGLSTLNILFD